MVLQKIKNLQHVHIICAATETIFTELIEAIQNYFYEKSRDIHVTYEYAFKEKPKVVSSPQLNIVIKAQRYFIPDWLPVGSQKVLIQTEQFSHLRKFNSMPHNENWDLILDVFKHQADGVNQSNVIYFPIGYDLSYDNRLQNKFVEDKQCHLDFYFFGARTKHRLKVWEKCVLPVSKNARFANTDHADKKYKNIIHTKINLYINGWEPYYLPMMHCMQVLGCQKYLFVISDTHQRIFSPYVEGRDFDVATTREAKDRLKTLLQNESWRKHKTKVMHKNLVNNYQFGKIFEDALSK